MSVLVKDNADFISLLINTTQIQGEALLDTITVKQIHVISEILRNLGKIPLSGEIKVELAKNEKLVKKIASTTAGYSVLKKGRIIGIHRKKIIRIFKLAKPILQAAIGRYCEAELESENKDTQD